MHDIEPHFHWRDEYIAADDLRSPFYGREYDEFKYSQRVYNYFIHPQWDAFGSATLYLKLLAADYDEGYAILEMMGEWNDCVHNDVMYLKREVIDPLQEEGIYHFILVMENVLYFHADDDDSYFQEWYEEANEAGGWIVLLNVQDHVQQDMKAARLDDYLTLGEPFNDINWRPHKPDRIFEAIDGLVQRGVKRLY